MLAAGVLLLGAVGAVLWGTLRAGGTDTGPAPAPAALPAVPASSGPVVYEVTGPAGATVTYSAGGSLGSVSRTVSLPWRVTVPAGVPGSVYTVSAAGGADGCAIRRGGRQLDRQRAAPGRSLVCSGAG